MPLLAWRVGWTRLVSSAQPKPRSKSIHSPVPVKPVWPIVSAEQASPPGHPAKARSQPQVRLPSCAVRASASVAGDSIDPSNIARAKPSAPSMVPNSPA